MKIKQVQGHYFGVYLLVCFVYLPYNVMNKRYFFLVSVMGEEFLCCKVTQHIDYITPHTVHDWRVYAWLTNGYTRWTTFIVKYTTCDDKSCSVSSPLLPCISSAVSLHAVTHKQRPDVLRWLIRQSHPTSSHVEPISC